MFLIKICYTWFFYAPLRGFTALVSKTLSGGQTKITNIFILWTKQWVSIQHQ